MNKLLFQKAKPFLDEGFSHSTVSESVRERVAETGISLEAILVEELLYKMAKKRHELIAMQDIIAECNEALNQKLHHEQAA